MKPTTTATILALIAATLALNLTALAQPDAPAANSAPPPPNAGWKQWTGATYKLQNWTTKPAAERFWDHGNGNFTVMLQKTDAIPPGAPRLGMGGGNRVEIRWQNWPDQDAEHMMEADVMYEKGTRGTCIMQIKTNTGDGGHESIYLNIRDDNCLHHGVNKTVIIDENGFDKWHNIKAAYDPITGLARVWVNNELKFQHTYPSGDGAVWYFKNGAYWASGTSKVHFKNLTFWVNPVKHPEEMIAATKKQAAQKAKELAARKIAADVAAGRPRPPNEGWTKWSPTYKLQNWTTRPDNECFWVHDDINFDFILSKSDAIPPGQPRPNMGGGTRVELRWPDWPDQDAEHMMEASVMYEKGTLGTCIMQIKTNTGAGGGGHESIYLVVRDGDLYHGVSKQPIIQNGYDKWHNIKAAYNPITGLARVWVNNELKFQHTYPAGEGSVWYFKNGAYWAAATSKVHFKNLAFWVNPVKESPETIAASKAQAAQRAAAAAAKAAKQAKGAQPPKSNATQNTNAVSDGKSGQKE